MTNAYAAFSGDTPLAPHTITRRDPGPRDVAIDILYCGVCHSDLHFVKGEWGPIALPGDSRPRNRRHGHRRGGQGQEVRGRRHRRRRLHGRLLPHLPVVPGAGLENYCSGGMVGTYKGVDKNTGGPTYGGYSDVDRGGQALRAPHAEEPRPRRRRAAALRRHHHLLAAAPLEGRQGQQGRRRRPRRPRPHGGQARRRDGRRSHRLHHLARQGRRRQVASAPTEVVISQERRRHGDARRQLRLHPRHRRRPARPRPARQLPQA